MKTVWCTFVLVNNALAPTAIYFSESDALKACSRAEGIAEIPVGQKLPQYVSELPKCYVPHQETWEGSRNYWIRQNASYVVKSFFEGAKK